jgi:hypothetical protein
LVQCLEAGTRDRLATMAKIASLTGVVKSLSLSASERQRSIPMRFHSSLSSRAPPAGRLETRRLRARHIQLVPQSEGIDDLGPGVPLFRVPGVVGQLNILYLRTDLCPDFFALILLNVLTKS